MVSISQRLQPLTSFHHNDLQQVEKYHQAVGQLFHKAIQRQLFSSESKDVNPFVFDLWRWPTVLSERDGYLDRLSSYANDLDSDIKVIEYGFLNPKEQEDILLSIQGLQKSFYLKPGLSCSGGTSIAKIDRENGEWSLYTNCSKIEELLHRFGLAVGNSKINRASCTSFKNDTFYPLLDLLLRHASYPIIEVSLDTIKPNGRCLEMRSMFQVLDDVYGPELVFTCSKIGNSSVVANTSKGGELLSGKKGFELLKSASASGHSLISSDELARNASGFAIDIAKKFWGIAYSIEQRLPRYLLPPGFSSSIRDFSVDIVPIHAEAENLWGLIEIQPKPDLKNIDIVSKRDFEKLKFQRGLLTRTLF